MEAITVTGNGTQQPGYWIAESRPRPVPELVYPGCTGRAGLQSVCENSFWVATVEGSAEKPAPNGAKELSPALQRWVKWEKLTSPFRDDTVLTHPLQARVPGSVQFRASAGEVVDLNG